MRIENQSKAIPRTSLCAFYTILYETLTLTLTALKSFFFFFFFGSCRRINGLRRGRWGQTTLLLKFQIAVARFVPLNDYKLSVSLRIHLVRTVRETYSRHQLHYVIISFLNKLIYEIYKIFIVFNARENGWHSLKLPASQPASQPGSIRFSRRETRVGRRFHGCLWALCQEARNFLWTTPCYKWVRLLSFTNFSLLFTFFLANDLLSWTIDKI